MAARFYRTPLSNLTMVFNDFCVGNPDVIRKYMKSSEAEM